MLFSCSENRLKKWTMCIECATIQCGMQVTDQLPKGKITSKSLRDKEAELNLYFENNIDIDGAKLTLVKVVDRYLYSLYNRMKLVTIPKLVTM